MSGRKARHLFMYRPRIEDGKIHTYKDCEISLLTNGMWEATKFGWAIEAPTWESLKRKIDKGLLD